MDFKKLFDQLKEIKKAPVPYIATICIVGAAVFYVTTWRDNGTISAQAAEIEQLKHAEHTDKVIEGVGDGDKFRVSVGLGTEITGPLQVRKDDGDVSFFLERGGKYSFSGQ